MKKYLVLTILFLIFYIMYCGRRNTMSNSIVITNTVSNSSNMNSNSPNAMNNNANQPQPTKDNSFWSNLNPKNWFADEAEMKPFKTVLVPFKNNSIWDNQAAYVYIKQDKNELKWDNYKATKAALNVDIGNVIRLDFENKRIHLDGELYAYFNTDKIFEDGYKIMPLNKQDKEKAMPLLSKNSFVHALKANDELYIACQKIGKDTIVNFSIISPNNNIKQYTYINAQKYEIELFGNERQR